MKLVYDGQKRFRILFPVDLMVEKGTEYEAKDKDTQRRLKELGFKEVKSKNEKEGDN